ncbi:uncharacterized protein LOC144473446 isoform X2 [Augochlora pura]
MRDRSGDRADYYLNNSNYKDDVNYTLEMCRWVMRPIGIWSFVYHRISKLEKLVSIVMLTLCFSDLLFSIIPPGHYLIFVEKNMYVTVKLLGPLGFCVSSMIKYLYLVLKGNVFKDCIVHVERDWQTVVDQRYRQIMLRQSSISRNLIILCAVFLYSGGMSYHTIMPFVSKPKMRGNVTLRPLIYPGYDTFFDSQASPTFSKNVEEALREICLTEIVESTFILCVLEYYCLLEWQNSDVVAIFTYFMLLVSFTFNISIFCYIGEILTEQCSKIGPAAYEINWYNLPSKKAHDLVLLSVVSNYPPKLTAGKIFTLSLNTFSSVMQSSVIYLNLLRTVMT